jgi:hypothetical protein
MPRPTHSSSLRTLAAAGLLGAAGLVAPATSRAQIISSPRALLNQTTSFPAARAGTTWSPSSADPAAVTSERALLGRASDGEIQVVRPSWTAAAPESEVSLFDGERALLGRGGTFLVGR